MSEDNEAFHHSFLNNTKQRKAANAHVEKAGIRKRLDVFCFINVKNGSMIIIISKL